MAGRKKYQRRKKTNPGQTGQSAKGSSFESKNGFTPQIDTNKGAYYKFMDKIRNKMLNFGKKKVNAIKALLQRMEQDPNNAKKYWQQAKRDLRDTIQGIPDLAQDVAQLIKGVGQIKGDNKVAGIKNTIEGGLETLERSQSLGKRSRSFGKNFWKGVGAFVKNIAPHINTPKWYTNLDMHTSFNISKGYPQNLALDISSTSKMLRAPIAILDIHYNPVASRVDRLNRLNQELDLLKGVRGLSGLLPYNVNDLAHYQDLALLAINEYGRLKFALKLLRWIQLDKVGVVKPLIETLGFEFEDMQQNRALYVNALTYLANFISNTLPITGDIVDKVFHSWDCFIPDSNDKYAASYYKTNLHMIATNTLGTTYFTDRFATFTPIEATSVSGQKAFFSTGTVNTTYNQYQENLDNFITFVQSQEIYTAIRADMIGAFSTSVLFVDQTISDVDQLSPAIIGPYDELYLNMIHNATVMAPAVEFDKTFLDVYATVGYSAPFSYDLTNDNVKLISAYTGEFQAGNIPENVILGNKPGFEGGQFSLASSSGLGSMIDQVSVDFINNYNDEGEQLETVQLLSIVCDKADTAVTNNRVYVWLPYDTHEFALNQIGFLLLDNENVNSFNTIDYIISTTNVDSVVLTTATLQQFDWAPKLTLNFIGPSNSLYSQYIWDLNIVGSMSRNAVSTSIRYSTYSLFAPNVQIANTRITNIANVYGIR